MRDYLVLGLILGSLPFCFIRPYIGIYVWYWVSLMNPHRLTWSIGYNFPAAKLVGITTLAGFLFMKNRGRLPKDVQLYLLVALFCLFTINTYFAIFRDEAWQYWQQVFKIFLTTILTIWLIDSKEKLRVLLFVITLSIGFFALKGVPWAIATGGKFRLYGPPGSFVGSNNAMGMALNMTIPLVLFLARSELNFRIKVFYYALFVASIMGVILTYSRGAFLGLTAISILLILRARRKIVGVLFLVVSIAIVCVAVPEKWFSRMHTIETYEKDESAMDRIETWKFGWNLALHRPLTGGGFHAFNLNPLGFYSHSVYFGILAEQGFIAFGVFLLLIVLCLYKLQIIHRKLSVFPVMSWYSQCAAMLQVGLVAYLVNGLTLGKQYFDMFYLYIALSIVLNQLCRKDLFAYYQKISCGPIPKRCTEQLRLEDVTQSETSFNRISWFCGMNCSAAPFDESHSASGSQ